MDSQGEIVLAAKGTVIELNELEQAVVELVTLKRQEHNEKVKTKETNYTGVSTFQNNLHAYGAEYAFCIMNNLNWELVYNRFPEYDCITHDGIRIDVKYTHRDDLGDLLVKVKKWKNPPHCFALMTGAFPRYTLEGYMWSIDIFQDDRINYQLQHPAFVAKNNELLLVP